MTPSVPDDVAARVRRLPLAQQQQALASVAGLERALQPSPLLGLAGSILPAELKVIAAASEADCERVDAAGW